MNPNITTTTKPTIPAYMASSVDNTAVSARVSGIVLALSSVIIMIASSVFQVTLQPSDIISLSTSIGAIAGAIWTLKGAIIWLMTKFGKKTPDVVTPVVSVNPNTVVPPPGQKE